MCGRYYVDDDTAREIEKVVREVDEKLRRERRGGYLSLSVCGCDHWKETTSFCGRNVMGLSAISEKRADD